MTGVGDVASVGGTDVGVPAEGVGDSDPEVGAVDGPVALLAVTSPAVVGDGAPGEPLVQPAHTSRTTLACNSLDFIVLPRDSSSSLIA